MSDTTLPSAKTHAGLDIRAILEHLPHRYPMLLVDRVLDVVPGQSIHAIKNVSINEAFFMGHFPHIPVFLGPYSHEKYMHVRNPGDILIDDRRSNCDEWERAGGQAHQYKAWPECKVWFEERLGTL